MHVLAHVSLSYDTDLSAVLSGWIEMSLFADGMAVGVATFCRGGGLAFIALVGS